MANLTSTYLNPETVARLDNLSLRARLIVEGFMTGLHRSPKPNILGPLTRVELVLPHYE